MPPPLPRRSDWVFSLISPSRISLPRLSCRVGLRIVLFEVCSAFTHVAACTLAPSPYVVTAIRGLQTFRRLHACPDCFRRELSPGGSRTHWKAPPLHGARSKVTFLKLSATVSSCSYGCLSPAPGRDGIVPSPMTSPRRNSPKYPVLSRIPLGPRNTATLNLASACAPMRRAASET